jgi:hypothetical protein
VRTATTLFENNPFLLFATLQTAIILFATTVTTTAESVYNLFSQKIPMQRMLHLQSNNIEVK